MVQLGDGHWRYFDLLNSRKFKDIEVVQFTEIVELLIKAIFAMTSSDRNVKDRGSGGAAASCCYSKDLETSQIILQYRCERICWFCWRYQAEL